MRAPNLASIAYAPATAPTDPELLRRYLEDEFAALARAIAALAAGHLDKTTVAPSRPRDGDVHYADGAGWNPGLGAGVYWFNGTSWTKL